MAQSQGCRLCEAISVRSDAPAIRYPPAAAPDEQERADRILGCLIGGAIGDAIGRLRRAGEAVPAEPDPGSLAVGGATQLSLFTAEGMVRMLVRFHAKGIGPAFVVVKHAYDRWLFTQHHDGDEVLLRDRWAWGAGDGWPDGWLVRQHSLHARRSAMRTTVAALRQTEAAELGEDRRFHPRHNTSKGSGGLVRVAPAGLLVREDFAFEMGVRCAGYTHGHPEAFLSAGIQCRLMAGLVSGKTIRAALGEVRSDLLGWPGVNAFYKILDAIGGPPGSVRAGSEVVKALVIGANAAQRDSSALDAVVQAATDGGTAAAVIAGQLIGTAQGAAVWPDPWHGATEVTAVIEEMAEAISVAHRAWMMDRPIAGADWETESIFEEHPVSMLLWPRFPGW
jgi:ADP-ribosylglycohydrolase